MTTAAAGGGHDTTRRAPWLLLLLLLRLLLLRWLIESRLPDHGLLSLLLGADQLLSGLLDRASGLVVGGLALLGLAIVRLLGLRNG